MNPVCSTCQNPLSCSNCHARSVNFSQPTNLNNNNSNIEFTELSGTLQRNLGTKQTKTGKDFFFGNLKLDDDTEQVFFFFDPDYDLLTKLHSLNAGDYIKVSGFINKGRFTARKLIEEESEVF